MQAQLELDLGFGFVKEKKPQGFELRIEKVADVYKEIDRLARKEHEEMEAGLRPFGPDYRSIIANEKVGSFVALTARKDGRMIGYLTWMIDFDMESYGTLIVHQCAWYVEPGHFGVAQKMFDWAIREFRRLGVKIVYLHNAMRGRGQTLGRFFERQGAILISNTYALKLARGEADVL